MYVGVRLQVFVSVLVVVFCLCLVVVVVGRAARYIRVQADYLIYYCGLGYKSCNSDVYKSLFV